jgi:hypothetical protein
MYSATFWPGWNVVSNLTTESCDLRRSPVPVIQPIEQYRRIPRPRIGNWNCDRVFRPTAAIGGEDGDGLRFPVVLSLEVLTFVNWLSSAPASLLPPRGLPPAP